MIEHLDGALVGERAEDRAADIAGQYLAAQEHHHAEQKQRDQRERQSPGEKTQDGCNSS
jgi:hypothetical protein